MKYSQFTLGAALIVLSLPLPSMAAGNGACIADSIDRVEKLEQVLPDGVYAGKNLFGQACTVEVSSSLDCDWRYYNVSPYNRALYTIKLTYSYVAGNDSDGKPIVSSVFQTASTLSETVKRFNVDPITRDATFLGFFSTNGGAGSPETHWQSIRIQNGNKVTIPFGVDGGEPHQTCILGN